MQTFQKHWRQLTESRPIFWGSSLRPVEPTDTHCGSHCAMQHDFKNGLLWFCLLCIQLCFVVYCVMLCCIVSIIVCCLESLLCFYVWCVQLCCVILYVMLYCKYCKCHWNRCSVTLRMVCCVVSSQSFVNEELLLWGSSIFSNFRLVSKV